MKSGSSLASKSARRKRPQVVPKGAPPRSLATAIRYVESSALLADLLDGNAAARRAVREPGLHVTSALTLVEAKRGLARARLQGRVRPDQERAVIQALETFERRCVIFAITDQVLARAARRFPVEPVRTLDAIHLATLELLGEPPQLVTIVTRDARVADNARALGYAVD